LITSVSFTLHLKPDKLLEMPLTQTYESKNADQIVFMKKGKIENVGTFQDLLEQREDFKRMVELQEI
jgi:ABC-type transport system involved in cytochrome bd biosynthesis fused ATPase/permease subunit